MVLYIFAPYSMLNKKYAAIKLCERAIDYLNHYNPKHPSRVHETPGVGSKERGKNENYFKSCQ